MDFRPIATAAPPPAWQSFAHLYVPVITILVLLISPINPFKQQAIVISSIVPTHLVATLIYPSNRPPLTPEQRIPFTRRDWRYRAVALLTSGILFHDGSFLRHYIPDLILDGLLREYIIPTRNFDEPQRRSEFFPAALGTIVAIVLSILVSPSLGWIWNISMAFQRTLWRAAYLGLVDDLIKMLGYPSLDTWKERALVILVQTVLIVAADMWVTLVFSMRNWIHGTSD